MHALLWSNLVCLVLIVPASGYDPLFISGGVEKEERSIEDSARNRKIPILIYLPSSNERAPVILFSHGLGGSRNGSAYLGQHWAGRGYVAVFLQHPGSDADVWLDAAPGERMEKLRRAASPQNFFLRVKDVSVVLDQLGVWERNAADSLAGRLDLEHVGMSGHSFGAVTTQAVSGQAAGGQPRFADSRIQAAIAMSPGLPRLGSPAAAFGGVSIPWLLMTGTHDTSIVGDSTPEQRAQVYPALPPGGKYQLILDQAEHSAFSDRPLPGDKKPRNPNHHRAILALSTAFWDAYLKSDAEARAWLDGPDARSVLEVADRWERK